jgi:hypothetical protein
MLGIDLDKGPTGGDLDQPGALEALHTLQKAGYATIYHSTHSYAPPHKSTWRVFLALSRPVTGPEFKHFWKAAITHLGIPTGIKTDFPARFWYLPSCPPDGPEPEAGHFPGKPLDVDALLENYTPSEPTPLEQVTQCVEYPAAPRELLEHVWARLHEHGPHIAGRSDDAHTYIAGAMLTNDFALSYQEAWPLLKAWNERNQPPWDEAALQNKLTVQPSPEHPYGAAREGWLFLQRLQAPPPEPGAVLTFAQEVARARADITAALVLTAQVTEPVAMFEDACDLIKREFPATPWQVRGLMTQKSVGTISGEPKSCKSWAALDIGIAIGTGTKAFGEFVTERGTAAYFFAEDQAAAVKTRINALMKRRAVPLGGLYVQPRGYELDVCNDDSLAMLLASARRLPGLSLLILDPLRDIHGAAEDSSDEMSKVMRRLRVLASLLDCSVLFVHHAAKAGADVNSRRGGQKMRGSGAVHASIDNGLHLSGLSGDGETVFISRADVEVKAGRSAGTFNLGLELTDNEHGQAVDAVWSVTRGMVGVDTDEDVTAVIEAIGQAARRVEPPPTAKEILKVVKGGKSALDRNIAIAAEAGYIQKHMVGAMHRGWTLTHTGKRLFEEITGTGRA